MENNDKQKYIECNRSIIKDKYKELYPNIKNENENENENNNFKKFTPKNINAKNNLCQDTPLFDNINENEIIANKKRYDKNNEIKIVTNSIVLEDSELIIQEYPNLLNEYDNQYFLNEYEDQVLSDDEVKNNNNIKKVKNILGDNSIGLSDMIILSYLLDNNNDIKITARKILNLDSCFTQIKVNYWLDNALYFLFGNRITRQYFFKCFKNNKFLIILLCNYLKDINKELFESKEKDKIINILLKLSPIKDLLSEYEINDIENLSYKNENDILLIVRSFLGSNIIKFNDHDNYININPNEPFVLINYNYEKDFNGSWESINNIVINDVQCFLKSFILTTVNAAGRFGKNEHSITFYEYNNSWFVIDNESKNKITEIKQIENLSYKQKGPYKGYGKWNFKTCHSIFLYYTE